MQLKKENMFTVTRALTVVTAVWATRSQPGHSWRDIRCSEETLFAASDWTNDISQTRTQRFLVAVGQIVPWIDQS